MRFVSFATKGYVLRQWLQALSLRVNMPECEISLWNSKRLYQTDLFQKVPWFDERYQGFGYWAWKPFIILKELEMMKEGDFLIYSDSGRPPGCIFTHSFNAFIDWLDEKKQDVMPGVNVSYYCGDLSRWIKPTAVKKMNLTNDLTGKAMVQASFLFMKKSKESILLMNEWFDLCRDFDLVSTQTKEDIQQAKSNFVSHTHDQTLLSVLIDRYQLHYFLEEKGIAEILDKSPFNEYHPSINDKDPDVFLSMLNAQTISPRWKCKMLSILKEIIFFYERSNNKIRKKLGFEKHKGFYS